MSRLKVLSLDKGKLFSHTPAFHLRKRLALFRARVTVALRCNKNLSNHARPIDRWLDITIQKCSLLLRDLSTWSNVSRFILYPGARMDLGPRRDFYIDGTHRSGLTFSAKLSSVFG